jgi:hypothetical protein
MPIEIWIFCGLAFAALAGLVALRVRRSHRVESREAKSIYPLW